MVYALGRLQNPTLRHSLTSQQFHGLSELITLQTNISLRGALYKDDPFCAASTFSFHFHWKQTSFLQILNGI